VHDVFQNVVFHHHFVICIRTCLVWIDVSSVKHYLNAMKAKRMPRMRENPWSAVGNLTSALGHSGSSCGPSSLVPIGIHHLLLSNLTTGRASRTRPHCPHLQTHPQTHACLHSNVRMRSVNASRCAFTETFSSAHLCCAAYAYNCFLSLSLANCGQQTAGGTGRAAGCHTGV